MLDFVIPRGVFSILNSARKEQVEIDVTLDSLSEESSFTLCFAITQHPVAGAISIYYSMLGLKRAVGLLSGTLPQQIPSIITVMHLG